MPLPTTVCLHVAFVIGGPILAVVLAAAVGLIVRRYYSPSKWRHSKEPLIKEGEPKPSGYDALRASSNFLAAVVVSPTTDEKAENAENAEYKIQLEKLTEEIVDKDKQIEKLAAEKEEFSVFLIRDLLASQKQTEELQIEVEALRRMLGSAEAQMDTPPSGSILMNKPLGRKSVDSEEILKLKQNVQELHAKIKTLELQLRAQKQDSDAAHLATTSPRPSLNNIYKSPDLSRDSSAFTPRLGSPTLESEETIIEAKKREMEITKEFTHRASFSRDASQSALKWRMEKGNKLDSFDKDGYLLIHKSVLEDRWDVVKHLLQIGADINSFDARGETALHLAVRNENILMTDYLLVNDADPNATNDRDKRTPLHLCAHHGSTKCAAALIAKGADLESKTENGYTPLRIAVEREQVDFAIWLVEKHKANINCVDDLGETILTYAVRINRSSLVDFLLDSGAMVDLVDGRNLTPLMVAARADNSDLIRLLVNRGALVDATNSDGKTALHFSASAGSASAAETLLELGANVDAKDEQGNAPIHESCKHSKFGVSARLVAWRADLCVQGMDGLSPLAHALCCNDNDTVTLLLSNGASNNVS